MKVVFLGMGVFGILFWLYILIDLILTITFGWPDRDLAFGFVFLLMYPIIPILSFLAVIYLKHLEVDNASRHRKIATSDNEKGREKV